MKVTITKKVEVEVKTLHVKAGVRYWEDNEVNGVSDEGGTLLPCRDDDDYWCPIIAIDTGEITNWTKGVTATMHSKVCDDGTYIVRDIDGNPILEREGYVPDTMCPDGEGYGDYIIMRINEDGFIQNWHFHADDFYACKDSL